MYFSNRAKTGKKYIEKIHQIATSTTGLSGQKENLSRKNRWFDLRAMMPPLTEIETILTFEETSTLWSCTSAVRLIGNL